MQSTVFLRRQEGYISDCRYDQRLRQQTSATPITPVTPPSSQTSDVISESFPSSLVDYSSTPKRRSKVSVPVLSKGSEPLWSEFLSVPSVAYKTKQKSPGRARILTSAEFMHALEEKELKKKEAVEEKQRRKREREETQLDAKILLVRQKVFPSPTLELAHE